MDIIDQLAILDRTGTDLIECMYGYIENSLIFLN
jgi:hypothetical protein